MADLSIRRARRDDAETVGALWRRLLAEQAALDKRFAATDDALTRWRNDFSFWVRDEEMRVFLAEEEGSAVGYLRAWVQMSPPVFAARREVFIGELFVKGAARQRGVGHGLVEAARVWAESIAVEAICLGVLSGNLGAQAFWRRLGAQPLHETLEIQLSGVAKAERKRARLGF